MDRITLVKSVLGSMPIYILSSTILSKSLVSKLEQYFQSFLWGSHSGGHGLYLLAWNVVCQPLREGGLGI